MWVTLCDVGPRDGLQNEPETLPPATRADLVRRLAAAGLPRIEAVSFVRDDRVPQMAGAEEVVAGLERRDGVEYSGLVLNERGWERFRAAGLDRVNVTFGATEGFNRANGNASLADAVAFAEGVVAGASAPATVTISVSFGCPFEGVVDPGRVADLAARFSGRAEVVLADTIGVATPSQVREARRAHRGRGLPRAQHAQHRLRERARGGRGAARACSTRRSAGSAAARMRRARPATSRRRTSSTSSRARASRPASTSTRSSRSRSGSKDCSAGGWRDTSTAPGRGRRAS